MLNQLFTYLPSVEKESGFRMVITGFKSGNPSSYNVGDGHGFI